MTVSLRAFISHWNRKNENVKFSIPESFGSARPTKVEMRFSPIKDEDVDELWEKATFGLGFRSKCGMVITTNKMVFKSGICDIAIPSQDPAYTEEKLIEVLRWFGEVVFQPSL